MVITTAPGRYLLFYDGQCQFCELGSRRLVRLARPGLIERVNFQLPGALDAYPELTHDACMQEMKLVTADGRVYGGMEALARALATRRIIGGAAYLYYVPGVRQSLDALYRWLAARRYRVMGKAGTDSACDNGACALHFGKQRVDPPARIP
jgi:predicted DCC family thiol-disulfide oxidoreductase YuxK